MPLSILANTCKPIVVVAINPANNAFCGKQMELVHEKIKL